MHEHDIDTWVEGHRDDLSAVLRGLVEAGAPEPDADDRPSVSGAVELTVAAAERLGFDVEVKSVERSTLAGHPAFLGDALGSPVTYVVARRPGTGGGRSLVLNGHLDVVEAGAAELWTHGAFAGDVVDGNLFGRGTSDAKGPFVAALFGAACAADVAPGLYGDLTVVGATDEEVGGMSTLASLVDGVTADAVLVGEPTELGIAPACRGFASFSLTVEGKHAHAGAGFEGVNAIVKAALCITALDELQAELDARFPNELYSQLPVGHLVNVGKARGGEWTRSVPDRCTIDGSVGVIGDDDTATIRAALEAAIGRVADGDPWLSEHRPVIEWGAMALEPALTRNDDPFVQLVTSVVTRVTGSTPSILPLFGASDLRFYTRYFGIPGTHLGPGSMSRGHGANEFIELDDVITATRTVGSIALEWAGCSCGECDSGTARAPVVER